jgi:membrane-bound lytic murein transglycosylase A
VDRSYVPLGAPVFIDTRWPREDKPLQRLMVAQDTGGAIKGRVRADFFWGVGDEAGWHAGAMKYPGQMWMLLPEGVRPDDI